MHCWISTEGMFTAQYDLAELLDRKKCKYVLEMRVIRHFLHYAVPMVTSDISLILYGVMDQKKVTGIFYIRWMFVGKLCLECDVTKKNLSNPDILSVKCSRQTLRSMVVKDVGAFCLVRPHSPSRPPNTPNNALCFCLSLSPWQSLADKSKRALAFNALQLRI